MIEFEEPEKGYVFQGANITKHKPKRRIFVLFVSFLLIVGLLIQNDYNFNFLRTNKLVANFNCSDENTFGQHDTEELNSKKAQLALTRNKSLLESERNFKSSQITSKENVIKNNIEPVINLYFLGETSLTIPNRMCDFKVNVFYK